MKKQKIARNKNHTNMQTQYEILQNNQINCFALQEKLEDIKGVIRSR
jgi:hypothetical protein